MSVIGPGSSKNVGKYTLIITRPFGDFSKWKLSIQDRKTLKIIVLTKSIPSATIEKLYRDLDTVKKVEKIINKSKKFLNQKSGRR